MLETSETAFFKMIFYADFLRSFRRTEPESLPTLVQQNRLFRLFFSRFKPFFASYAAINRTFILSHALAKVKSKRKAPTQGH